MPGEALYRVLLRLHPRRFRRRYEAELVACFREAWWEEAHGRGWPAASTFWARVIRGTVATAWEQRVHDAPVPAPMTGARRTMRERLESVMQDGRHALRMLRRNLGFTAAALGTLALAIGASTSVFAVVNGILLRPLPFPSSERLYEMSQDGPDGSYWLSAPNYEDMKRSLGAFESMGAYTPDGANVVVDGQPARLDVAEADADFFRTLGVAPVLGRTFTERERAEDAPVAVISHTLWRERLGGRRDVIGAKLVLDGQPREVIGVLPAGSMLPAGADVWTPLKLDRPDWRTHRGISWIKVVARLRAGADPTMARAQGVSLARSLRSSYPDTDKEFDVGYRSLQEGTVGSVRTELRILMAAVALLLLVAAFNVGALLIARGTARRAELALRATLGGGLRRLTAQLLTESAVLAVLGCLTGVALARLGLAALVAAAPADTPRLGEVRLGGGPVGFAILAAAGSALLFGVLPVITTLRGHASVLREARGGGSSMGSRLRGALVVAQVALALALLVGAGLLGKSFWRLQRVDLGMRPDGVVVAGLPIDDSQFASEEARAQYYASILERAQALPGVRSAALTSSAPFSGFGVVFSYEIPGRPSPTGKAQLSRFRIVTPELFRTLGIDFVRGRTFAREEMIPGHPMGAVVSEELVRRASPDRDPIGQTIITAGDTFRIVGVVREIRDVSARAPSPFPHVYVPVQPSKQQSMMLVARTDGDPAALLEPLRRAVHETAPLQPLPRLIADSAAQPRFTLLLLTFFAAATLLLAAVGLYGVLAFAVARRTREIGVRMALGAQPHSVRGLVVRQSLRLTAFGLVAGAVVVVGGVRFLDSMLFEVRPHDASILAAVATVLLLVALLAAWLPARWATRIAPAEALRAD